MSLTLSEAEIVSLTGFKLATRQLEVLRARGFYRASIPRKGGPVVVPRIHYEAELARQAEPPPALPTEEDEAMLGYVRPLHWRSRPEHQERVLAERAMYAAEEAKRKEYEILAAAQRQAWRAESIRTRPERRAVLVRYHANKRRVARLQRTPLWADQDAIKAIYAEALRLKRETGVEHHVDHIIPLQGELVSGLHVENNLQVLPWRENILKRNHFEVAD
jgi:hypothetical protein